ncbi:predicted protein, partial [Nematostella vectensis]
LGNLYHAQCFLCHTCGKELRGQEFYRLENRVYCKQDYKSLERHQRPKRCHSCKEVIGQRILQTLGRDYHPVCFRCCVCEVELEGTPFTVDRQNAIYCIPDYHRKYSPRCHACREPIAPDEKSDETIRVVCLGKQFHDRCFKCEVTNNSLYRGI